MRTLRMFTVCALLLCASASIRAQDDSKSDPKSPVTSLPAIPSELHDEFQDREFVKAIQRIDTLLKNKNIPSADYLLYLKGRAQTELKLYDQATQSFDQLERGFPDSRWAARARFGRAEVQSRQRNYRTAGEIYQAEAKRLLSAGRRDELTGIYLEFADRFFEGVVQEGPTEERKPDYQQALTFYREALQLKPSLKRRQKIELRIARSLQELGNLPEAISAYQQFLAGYAGEKTEEHRLAEAALEVDARFQLGRAQLAAGQPTEARKTFSDFLADEQTKTAGGELIAEATFQLAKTHGVPNPSSVRDLELGVAALERFLEKFPKHKLAAQAEYEMAQSYLHHGRYEQGVSQLKSLIENENYQKSDHLAEARKLLGQSFLAQKKFDEAIAAWKEFLEAHPTHPDWSNVQRQVIDGEFQRAADQMSQQKYELAIGQWQTFLNKYPLDARAPQILFQFGRMKFITAVARSADQPKDDKRAENFTGIKPEELFNQAIADWKRLISKYPGSNEASQAAFMIGVTLEDQLGQLADALEAYKKVTGSFQPQAQQRIAKLTDKQLSVVTERKFRSNEQPKIKLTTRNIEKVTVKMYRIDMADYFRKMHLATGVETLDIALIDPDKQSEYSVENYEQYRSLENDVDIPMDGPGVTAVTVSSDKTEATTMVIVSDIDVVVKCSRNELFLFAENMRTQKPAAGVSLLISNGQEVFAEELTGEDGVVQKAYEDLKSIEDLRVFAIQEGHAASTVINLSGLDFAVGLSPKGYLYTDRPAYRAGQLVNLKGIVRWVEDDRFTFKEGEEYRLDVYDARGRVLHTNDVKLGKFGTVHDHLVLPETAPQGQYRVHLHQPGRSQSYETTFVVHELKLEPIHITVDLDEQVVYRGETIRGSIALQYYYGTPLANRQIQYRLADGRLHIAETDAEGKVEFEFTTERFNESQALPLYVHYPERNLSAGETIFLATRGFAIATKTLRNLYITGETFDVTASVADPAGEPVGVEMTLEVLKQTMVRGQTGERLISKFEVTSDEETGEARHTVRIDEAGRYILRFTGTDRFGNKVSGAHVVHISGEEDSVRLRILAEQHAYDVGDEATVQVHWREKPALALVTFEGATILDYRLVELKTGSNALTLPLDSELAPNFVLAIAVMEGNKYHEARSEFRVSRKLNIALEPDKTELKPGEELTVGVKVTDAQGQPVSAELSLAMIQQNLLDTFAENRPAIAEFFGEGYRQIRVRAATSANFRYTPSTQGINQFLLAEAERQAILQRELESLRQLTAQQEMIRDALFSVEGELAAGTPILPRLDFDGDVNLSGNYSGVINGRPGVSGPGGAPSDYTLTYPGYWTPTQGVDRTLILSDGSMPAQQRQQLREYFEHYQRQSVGGRQSGEGFGFGSGGMGGGGFGSQWGGQQFDRPPINGEGQSGAGDRLHMLNSASTDDYARTWTRLGRGRGDVDFGYGDGGVRGLNERWDDGGWYYRSFDFKQAEDKRILQSLTTNGEAVLGINSKGNLQVINGMQMAALEEFGQDGLQVLPSQATSETGYWNPIVVTGDEGQTELKFQMPDRSTAWRLSARGATSETMTGQAAVDIITKKDLFGEIRTPLAFYEGDKTNIVVEVHNTVVPKGDDIAVTLTWKLGGRSTEETKTVESIGPGVQELTFPVEITSGQEAEFHLTVSSGLKGESHTETVPVLPFGMPAFATASGSSGQSTIVFVDFDKQLTVEDPELEILIGASVNRSLLDAVVGGSSPVSGWSLSNDLERLVSDVLGGVALLGTTRDSNTADTPEADALSGKVQSAVSRLVSSQRDDGGWSWSGRPWASGSDRLVSSRVVWALADARRAGFAVPNDTYNKGVQFLRSAFTATRPSDRETQAILLHGLTEANAGDFAFANRLYRERNALSASGLLHTALALVNLDRKEMAADLLSMVKIPVQTETANNWRTDPAIAGVPPWMQSGVELRALWLLALEEVPPVTEQSARLADWLLAARQGNRWSPEKSNGPAIAALAKWLSRTKQSGEKYELDVYVNGQRVEKISVDPSKDATRKLAVPAEFLAEGGQQKINIDMQGRGTFSYSAILRGFVPADKLASTTNSWRVRRTYEPTLRMLDGVSIPRGFGILTGGYSTFSNPLTQLSTGDRGEVTLRIYRTTATGTDDPRDYLVVTEPIPAGTMVLTDSIRGGFERYEITPGAITFYIGDRSHPGNIHYTLVGYLPGDYQTVPTVVRSFYRPERIAIANAKSLAVLPKDAESQDEYKLTPVELYEFGKRMMAKREFASAADYLTPLFKEYRLKDDTYQHVVRLLFQAALEMGRNEAIVEYFEVIKEKYPEVEIDFDSILKVGEAYRQLGEYERSYLVFRATVEARFERESRIAGFLHGQGEFLRSVQVVEDLLREYPAEPYVATATYALTQEVYGKAPEAATNEKLREAGLTRINLIATSVRMLDHFLTTWPTDPAADEAAFSMASALLDLEDYDATIERCEKFAERYADSELLDSYWYFIGFSQFALGRHDEALEISKKIAEYQRKNKSTGQMIAATNKWQAIYIMGQIHHSLGQPTDAIQQYERVDDRFPDAKEAIEYFTRKEIELPEVTTIRPDQPAKVELNYRNIANANVKVYRIDLMKFGLMQRNLDRITAINLAGIRPYHELSLEFGNGKDFADRKRDLELPLKEEGAYLVVCRGENLYASGLVLVSPLELEVQEDSVSGRVRVTVKDADQNRYLRDVHVKVIGSSNADFTSGETDLRGIFTADGITGMSTVMARIGEDQYAFHRGEMTLGQPTPQANASAEPQSEAAEQQKSSAGNEALLKNLREQNSIFNDFQRSNYDQLLNNKSEGVKVKSAY